jgi:nitric oxide reductase NorE protein
MSIAVRSNNGTPPAGLQSPDTQRIHAAAREPGEIGRLPRRMATGRQKMNPAVEPPPNQPLADTDPAYPGTSGIWTFLFIDTIVFSLLFLVYLSERHRLPALFMAGQAKLAPLVGLTGTILLLTSSWAMAAAIRNIRDEAVESAARRLMLALVFGLGFVANKLWEYHLKLAHGLSPASDGFFTFYFIITGLHLLHVSAGLLLIAHMRRRLSEETGTLLFRKKAENIGLFWHFVDMLWLFIFPMLYLAGTR